MNDFVNDLYRDNKNIIVTGNISSGKTTNVLFPIVDKIIENDESICILDSKEEYIYNYYNTLNDKGYNITIINLRNPVKSFGFNPLKYPYELYKEGNLDKCIDVLRELGNSLFYENGKSDPFWSNSATDYFTGLALSLFEDAKEDEINLNSIYMLLNSRNRKIEKYIKLKDRNSKAYMSISPVLLAPSEIKGTIITIAREKIRDLIIKDNLSKMLSNNTINYKELSNNKNAIFIIGKDETLSLSRITSAFISELFQIFIDGKVENRYNFILDNIDTLDNISNFKEMLSSGISRNIRFIIGTRSYFDLEEKYTDYIKKMCDILEINGNEIDLYVDNKIKNYEFKCNNIDINREQKIDYPKLITDEIKVFSLGIYLKDCIVSKNNENSDVDEKLKEEEDKIEDDVRKYNELIEKLNLEIEKVDNSFTNNSKELIKENDESDEFDVDETINVETITSDFEKYKIKRGE